jgi:hypothetical protein
MTEQLGILGGSLGRTAVGFRLVKVLSIGCLGTLRIRDVVFIIDISFGSMGLNQQFQGTLLESQMRQGRSFTDWEEGESWECSELKFLIIVRIARTGGCGLAACSQSGVAR